MNMNKIGKVLLVVCLHATLSVIGAEKADMIWFRPITIDAPSPSPSPLSSMERLSLQSPTPSLSSSSPSPVSSVFSASESDMESEATSSSSSASSSPRATPTTPEKVTPSKKRSRIKRGDSDSASSSPQASPKVSTKSEKRPRVKKRDSDDMGYTTATQFQREYWSTDLVDAYEKTAKRISKSYRSKRDTTEAWGSPCRNAHTAFARLLSTLEKCFQDVEIRKGRAHSFAQELCNARKTINTPEALERMLDTQKNTIKLRALSPMALPSSLAPTGGVHTPVAIQLALSVPLNGHLSDERKVSASGKSVS